MVSLYKGFYPHSTDSIENRKRLKNAESSGERETGSFSQDDKVK